VPPSRWSRPAGNLSGPEFGPVASPALHDVAPYDYDKKVYNLDTWDLGSRPLDSFGPRHGYLGVPTGQPNASGATFKAY
jgi:hypothetical protein